MTLLFKSKKGHGRQFVVDDISGEMIVSLFRGGSNSEKFRYKNEAMRTVKKRERNFI